jgi:hypothetical protein
MLKNKYEKFEHEFTFKSKEHITLMKEFLEKFIKSKAKKDAKIILKKDNELFTHLYNTQTCKIICPTFYFGAIRFLVETNKNKLELRPIYCNAIKEQIKLFFY